MGIKAINGNFEVFVHLFEQEKLEKTIPVKDEASDRGGGFRLM